MKVSFSLSTFTSNWFGVVRDLLNDWIYCPTHQSGKHRHISTTRSFLTFQSSWPSHPYFAGLWRCIEYDYQHRAIAVAEDSWRPVNGSLRGENAAYAKYEERETYIIKASIHWRINIYHAFLPEYLPLLNLTKERKRYKLWDKQTLFYSTWLFNMQDFIHQKDTILALLSSRSANEITIKLSFYIPT